MLYNQQMRLLGGEESMVEWPDKIQAEIEEWESMTVDSRNALVSNDEVRFNTALKKEGYISLNDLSQTLVSPDGQIPIKESEFSELVKRTGYNNAITYEEFLNNPVLVDKVLKIKMKDGLKLIEGTTNNESIILRKLTSYMMTGDTENYNKGDFANFTLEALNAYHSGNNSRLNTFFKKHGIKPNLKIDVPYDYSEIDTQATIITAPLANTVADLEAQLQSMRQRESEILRREAESTLKQRHPDFEDLRGDEQFHEWAREQPEQIQDWIYNNPDNVTLASKAIDLYKLETGISQKQQPKQVRQRGTAPDMVSTKTTSVDAKQPKIWTEREIAAMSLDQFDKYEDEIKQAMTEGRVVK